jgi:8-oxo-dGTP diphosphatase
MQALQVFRSYEPAGAEAGFRYCPQCGSALAPAAGTAGGRQRCAACGYVRYRNPLPGVVVLVEEYGAVLLCKRAAGSFRPGLWCLPGGFIEYDEDFLSAGIREVREETGFMVGITSILSVVTNFLAPELHTLVTVLAGRVIGGAASPGDDAADLAWCRLDTALPPMAFEADRHIIQRYAAQRGFGAPVDARFAGTAQAEEQLDERR